MRWVGHADPSWVTAKSFNKIFNKFGLDKGFDIPGRTDYVSALKPLLDEVGLRTDLTIILFTLVKPAIPEN